MNRDCICCMRRAYDDSVKEIEQMKEYYLRAIQMIRNLDTALKESIVLNRKYEKGEHPSDIVKCVQHWNVVREECAIFMNKITLPSS